MNDSSAAILAEYDRQCALYGQFAQRCEALVKELLSAEHKRVHSVTSRLKGRHELEEKLQREGKNYKKLSDVTDTSGVRVITHFDDEVDDIGTLIEREFAIDRERSIDKRKTLDPDRFGYLSLHYICGFHPDRIKLSENRRYGGIVCEIQIRSILQHAWAEIEHDLGYKPNNIVPAPIRRRFSRLAGLLEIADQEFRSIRDELESYAGRVGEEIRSSPSNIEIDDVSLAALIENDELCAQIDGAMASQSGRSLLAAPLNPQDLADQLRYTGLSTVSDIRNDLAANGDLIVCQFVKRTARPPHMQGPLNRGICLLHAAQVRMARGGVGSLVGFFTRFGFRHPDKSLTESAQEVIEIIKRCQ